MRWRIELFGGLRALQGERVITRFQTQKTGALLAYLAYHLPRPLLSKEGSRGGYSHPREVLFELLWPECNPKAGRNSLSVALSSLRHQLEPPGVPAGAVIIADRLSVRLNPTAVTTDVAEFETALQSAQQTGSQPEQTHHLLTAVELYHGSLLTGYYENWILLEQQRLSELFFQALRELIDSLEETGDLPSALQYAHHGVLADPLREEAHYELMRLYALAGQRTAALRQYAELERILREEFDDAPTAATRELARRISERGCEQPTSAVSSEQLAVGRRQLAVGAVASNRRRQKRGVEKQQAEAVQPSTINHQLLTISHLPLQLTRFFGREAEIAWLQATLLADEYRLVTLTGSGGSGKTRLACEAAGRLSDAFNGAVWFVPLADISDPQLIVERMRDALQLPRSSDVEPLEQIVNALLERKSLVVMDNLEHLIRDDAEMQGYRDAKMQNTECIPVSLHPCIPHPSSLILTLLDRIPTLKLLVTSRQRLDVTGEREFFVPPLPTPGGEAIPESLVRCESVQLFIDRAQAVKPDFQVTTANAGALKELCVRLEGVPLAIELAAARAQVLSPAQMVAHLDDRFGFLVSRRRDVVERHRTLRAAMDWSYNLLSPELRQFFAQLSVFRGGWTLEAAEAVPTSREGSGFRVPSDAMRPHNTRLSTLNPQPSTLLTFSTFSLNSASAR